MRKHIISKWLLMTVVVPSVMTACSSDDVELFMPQEAPVPVLFTATDVEVVTRANEEKMTTPQMVAQAGGFGVFGYYTNGNGATDGAYSASATPNFMYNQSVTGTDDVAPVWSYTPLKYWPNETGSTAKSNHIDKLTFFAYAPYAAAGTTYNITGFSAENATGDPWVTYNSPKTAGYDLVYAKAVDQVKPNINDKVSLSFSHALANLSYEITNTSSLNIQKIEVLGWRTNGINIAGKLNLNTGTWSEISAKKDKTEVVFEKEADPLPLTGVNCGNWKVIPGDNQEFFVRITYKDAGDNLKVLPEIPFKENFVAGYNKVLQIAIP